MSCQVIAPALIPRKPGERVKTNTRDARKLAELLRAGLLTEVQPPTPADEAVRDLCRARDDAREDLQRCRHRLGKLLLRRGLHFGGRNWSRPHRAWIDGLEWAQPAERVVVDDYLLAIDHLEARLGALDTRLAEVAETAPYREPVGSLRCFRGIDTLTAIMVLAELHDFRRFQSPRALMAYVGLVPSEDSSGEKHRRGRITRTGNALVRRLLVETAWHYQHRPSIGVALAKRRNGQPGRVISIADKAQQRLCRRFRRLAEQHKPTPKIAVASPASSPGSCGPHSNRRRRRNRHARGSATAITAMNETMRASGNGPRRRRMIRGPIVRIGELAMRYGRPSQLATLDCTSSRRSTVMRALLRAIAVTTEYQSDSSSKRPRSSVVFAARAPARASPGGCQKDAHGLQGFAPCGRRLRRPWTPRASF